MYGPVPNKHNPPITPHVSAPRSFYTMGGKKEIFPHTHLGPASEGSEESGFLAYHFQQILILERAARCC